jgi:hypothetical protein
MRAISTATDVGGGDANQKGAGRVPPRPGLVGRSETPGICLGFGETTPSRRDVAWRALAPTGRSASLPLTGRERPLTWALGGNALCALAMILNREMGRAWGIRSGAQLLCACAVVTSVAAAISGCSKKEEPAAETAATASAVVSAEPVPVVSAPPPATTTAPPKVDHTADANAVSACCTALKGEASKAKAGDKGKYEAAAAVCGGLVESIRKGQSSRASVMGTLRAQMKGGALPGACN